MLSHERIIRRELERAKLLFKRALKQFINNRTQSKEMKNCRQDRLSPFVKKTHAILEVFKLLLENPEFSDIIRWHVQGDMFMIVEPGRMETELLMKYFKHSKLESFIRQLNIYGFKKVRKAIAANSFSHPDFLRGDVNRLSKIQRGTSKNKQKSKFSDQSDMASTTTQTKQKSNENDERLLETTIVSPEVEDQEYCAQPFDIALNEEFQYDFPEWAVIGMEQEPSFSI